MLTTAELRKIVGSKAPDATIEAVVKTINEKGPQFGLTRGRRLNHFLAHICHETMGLTKLEEDLYYTTPDRIRQVFGTHRAPTAIIPSLVKNPKALANQVYGGAWGAKNLGNHPGTDDGWLYRGSGIAHLTGRANFEEMGEKLGLDLIGNPDLARDPATSTLIALQFARSKGIFKAADTSSLEQTTFLWNGGYNGMDDRRRRYEINKRVLGA